MPSTLPSTSHAPVRVNIQGSPLVADTTDAATATTPATSLPIVRAAPNLPRALQQFALSAGRCLTESCELRRANQSQ
eukprot:CAMPEP_0183508804 /NCGR_PEP_ID=MMETSP0371-20130417/9135_1 /TAXON_ID=268820 /ORGANISM="Peridinium aciculiferum, Strain PAER-2" /LENGTH=76 /DNA_ID=CAMNT_0025705265 /DNA_START=136 /DNA_END=363 /DNA_ORIENTATION=-